MPHCSPILKHKRPKASVRFEIDLHISDVAARYAEKHGVTADELIECALVNFMACGMEPAPVQLCAQHGCLMEVNSSGTTMACPEAEGGTPIYLGQL